MSQKPGYPSRMQQVPYTRQSPNPASSHNMAQVHEPGFDEGRQPRDAADSDAHEASGGGGGGAADVSCGSATNGGYGAAERGPRKPPNGPGHTYLCIEVLGGGGGGVSGGGGGGGVGGGIGGGVGVGGVGGSAGGGGGGVGGRGSDGGNGSWPNPQSSPPTATPGPRTPSPWPNPSSTPEAAVAPNWPPGTTFPPWQSFPQVRDWPILDARMWPKYHYAPGRAEFAHAWCSQLSKPQIDQMSANHELMQPPQALTVNTCFPQPQSPQVMWNTELYESWKLANARNGNRTFCRGESEGPVHDQKDSGIDSPEPAQSDEASRKSPETVVEPKINSPSPVSEDSTRTTRGGRTDKTARHASKCAKKHNTRCKASLSSPLLPPAGDTPDTRTPPAPISTSRHASSIHRVQSDESFVRGPTTEYYVRRVHKVPGNDKRTIDADNVDIIKAGKTIRPPRAIKPVKAFRIMKQVKTEGDGAHEVPSSRAMTPLNGKSTKLHQAIPNRLNFTLNQKPETPPKTGTPANGSIRSPMKGPPAKKTSLRGVSPAKTVTNVQIGQRPVAFYHDMTSEKYIKNNGMKSTTYTSIDQFESGDRIDTINAAKQRSDDAIKLEPKTSFDSFDYEEVTTPIKAVRSKSYSREAETFSRREPIKGYDVSKTDRERKSPLKDTRSVQGNRFETNVRRIETENKISPSEIATRDHVGNDSPKWPFEHYASSNISRPKRSATESTFRIPNVRSRYTFQAETCRRDAAVCTGPHTCVISTQTDNEEDSEFGASDSYGPYYQRRPSAGLGGQRTDNRFPSDVTGIVTPADIRNSGFYNPYQPDQYIPYRSSGPLGTQDVMNPMCYAGYLSDGSPRDHICSPCVGCPNSTGRTPFWPPGSPFAGYSMPMSVHMPVPVPMCMTMPMPVPCPCESCGGGNSSADVRRHVDVVDVAVGDSNEDLCFTSTCEKSEPKIENKRSILKSSSLQTSDSECDEVFTPSARKRIELLLAGLTPKGKTLHPERLSTLLQDIPPDIIKKIIDDTAADIDLQEEISYERNRIIQEENNKKLRDLISALSFSSESKCKEDETEVSATTDISECIKVDEETVKRNNNIKENKDRKNVKIIVIQEERNLKIKEEEGFDHKKKNVHQEEIKEENKEKLEEIVPHNTDDKDQNKTDNTNTLKEEHDKSKDDTSNVIHKQIVNKTEEVTKDKTDETISKTDEKRDDKLQTQSIRHTLFRPTGEQSLRIKIRTRPLFRNQDFRDNITAIVGEGSSCLQHVSNIVTITDSESSTSSLNPVTSLSDVTTIEAVPTLESIVSIDVTCPPAPLECKPSKPISKELFAEEPNIIESSNLQLEGSANPEVKEKSTDEEVEIKERSIDEEIEIKEMPTVEEVVVIENPIQPPEPEIQKQIEEICEKVPSSPQLMERRYPVCPCPGVTFTCSKPTPSGACEQPSQTSRPNSPSRPVTVSPLRPLPRPVPPPRRQPATLLQQRSTTRRRRTISSLNENGSTSSANLHGAPQSGSIRPPRARVPQQLLQKSLVTAENATREPSVRKSCAWSRLSFLERTALARALVDSASCTVKVGDATVLLARSGLSSLMTIAEGILNQSRPAPKTGTKDNERKSGKSPRRSPVRAPRSPSAQIINSEKRKDVLSEHERENHRLNISVDETNSQLKKVNSEEKDAYPLKQTEPSTPLRDRSPIQTSTKGSKTSVSKRDTKSGLRHSFPPPPRGFTVAKGYVGKCGRNNIATTLDKKEENVSPDREFRRQAARTGRYCSMRINGPCKKPSTPPLLPPPRGFRGHGMLRTGRVMARKNDSLLAEAIRNANISESNFKRRLNYSERCAQETRDRSVIWKGTKEKLFAYEGTIENVTRCEILSMTSDQQNSDTIKLTRNGLYKPPHVGKSSNYSRNNANNKIHIEEIVNLLNNPSTSNSHPDILEAPNNFRKEIVLYKNLGKKCKSLALIDTLLTEYSLSELRKTLWRSNSSPVVRMNTTQSGTIVNRRRSGNVYRSNHASRTSSGHALYRPTGNSENRLLFRQSNPNETRAAAVGAADTPHSSTASLGGAHPDCCVATSSAQRRLCPSSSAPPGPKPPIILERPSRARISADDFFVLHPPKHTLQARGPSRPRLPVTAIAASQRVVSRSRSYASTQRQTLASENESEECRPTVARSALQVLPPSPWRDV